MSEDRKQINLVVTPEQKQKWDAYVEENSEVNSLSALIRMAVTREIDDGYVLRSDVSARNTGTPSRDVVETLQSIEEQVASMDDRLHSIEASNDSTPDEIKDLALSLVDALPKLAEHGTPQTAYVAGGTAITLDDSKFSNQIEALTDWANRNPISNDYEEKEWSDHDVRRALERAVNDFSRVQKTLAGTQPRYFEIDPDNPTEAVQ
jgi:hypothetical protein